MGRNVNRLREHAKECEGYPEAMKSLNRLLLLAIMLDAGELLEKYASKQDASESEPDKCESCSEDEAVKQNIRNEANSDDESHMDNSGDEEITEEVVKRTVTKRMRSNSFIEH